MKPQSNFNDKHTRYAVNLVLAYSGSEPFHLYLKKYFRANRKHGARDRKRITALCYQYFRLGGGLTTPMSMEEKMELADFLANDPLPLQDKLDAVARQFSAGEIFPFNKELSPRLDKESFNRSLLVQPMLFLRIRPGFRDAVLDKLTDKKIAFVRMSDSCIALENTTEAEKIVDINREAVVQDMSSQNTALFLQQIDFGAVAKPAIWDACAASGGKSILAADIFPQWTLTVSDKRKSILQNLQKRFRQAGIKKYRLLQLDLSKPLQSLRAESFDLIIADLPCSGSGTWGRTPEQLHFFEETQIATYATLQRKIVANALPALKKGGYLLYLTCSVFEAENEENVLFVSDTHKLTPVHQQYLIGYPHRADTLYGALLQI